MADPVRTPIRSWTLALDVIDVIDVRGWLALGLFAHLIVAVVCALSPTVHLGDFHRYWELATTPGRPYVDFRSEYPPGALLAFEGLAAVAGHPHQFNALLLSANVVADAAIVVVLARVWGLTAASVYAWVALPILSLLFFRFDLWPMAMVTAAVGLLTRGRPRPGVLLLCAGAAVKLWPLPFIALWLNDEWRPWRSPSALLFAVLTAAGAAGWLAWSGLHGVLDVLTFRGASGWDIESTVGSVWRVLEPGSLRHEAGAVRVGHNLPLLSLTLFALALPVSAWALWRGAQRRQTGTGWITGLGIVLACSALLSPQFLGWLLPGVAIARVEGDRRSARIVAGLVALTVAYRILHTQQMPGLVLLRNIALVWAMLQALRALAAQPANDQLVFRFEPDAPPHGEIAGHVDHRGRQFRPRPVE